jgi:hypothetical protein
VRVGRFKQAIDPRVRRLLDQKGIELGRSLAKRFSITSSSAAVNTAGFGVGSGEFSAR